MTTSRLSMCVALAALAAAPACRNSLSARVERVVVQDADRISPRSRIGRRLEEASRRLLYAESRLRAYDRAMQDVISKRGADATAFAFALKPTREVVLKTADTANKLTGDLAAHLGTKHVDPLALDARADLVRVDSFWAHDYPKAWRWMKLLYQDPGIIAAADKDGSILSVLKEATAPIEDQVKADQDSAPEATLGFGGFSSTDVYTLNPSDPAYEKVLQGEAVPVSAEPLTLARADATGESSIMIVFEQPSQARIFQVSADPTQIARNLGIITSKMSSAALRAVVGAGVP